MKINLIASLAFASVIAVSCWQPVAAADDGISVAYGIAFLPLDFYPKHREALGLSDDQVREMQQIVANMREPGEKLQAEIQQRAKLLQEAIGENPVNADSAMERFQSVVQAEAEMKALQFRTRIALRKVLQPEQYDKLRELAANANDGGQASSAEAMHEKLRLIREKISKYNGAPLPEELVAKLKHIEQMSKQGKTAEAEEHLDALLLNLKGDKASGAEKTKQQIEKLEAAARKTGDSAERERIKQQIRTLGEKQDTHHAAEHAGQKSDEELGRQIRRIAEAAERTENPKERKQLQGALHRLKEAAASGKNEIIGDILQSVTPLLNE